MYNDKVRDIVTEKLRSIKDEKVREALQDTLEKLAQRQENIRQELLDRLERELKKAETCGTVIVTTLLGDEESSGNFQPMLEEEQKDGSLTAFLACSYEELDEYMRDEHEGSYEGRYFRYRLRYDERYVSLENKFIQARRRIGDLAPVVWSPWARRAVRVEIIDEDIAIYDPEAVEWQQLQGKLLFGKHLCWNVKVTTKAKYDKVCAPEGDLMSYVTTYGIDVNAATTLYIEDESAGIEAIRRDRGEGTYTIEVHSRQKIADSELESVTLFSPVEAKTAGCEAFAAVGAGVEKFERLRTQGDIERVLQLFSHEGYSCTFKSCGYTGLSAEVINTYSAGREYWQDKSQLLYSAGRKKPKCYVKFSADGKRQQFLTDYASYVLYNLNYLYPEFQWLGVRA